MSASLINRSETSPDAIAFRFLIDGIRNEDTISYSELHSTACAVANRISETGGINGDRALLLFPSGLDYIAALYGCLYSGITAVPAYPPAFNRPFDRLGAQIENSTSRFALTSTKLFQQLQHIIRNNPILSKLIWIPIDRMHLETAGSCNWGPIDADYPAVIQYTSGSTSQPSGVMLSHRNLFISATLMSNHINAGPNDTLVAWLPPFHDMGLIGAILSPVLSGTETVLMSPGTFIRHPIRWLQAIDKYRGTISPAPNFAYDICVTRTTPDQRLSLDLSCWRVAINGAERVRPETLDRFSETYGPMGFNPDAFCPSYGLAEATLAVTMAPVNRHCRIRHFDEEDLGLGRVVPATSGAKRALASCGTTLPGLDVKIVDAETGMPVSDNKTGEIWIRGDVVSKGYWNSPEKNKEQFESHLFGSSKCSEETYLATGDIGFIFEDELYVVGRCKDLIIILGVNHYPEDIEATVEASHAAIQSRNAIAFALEMNGEEKLIVACEIDRKHEALTEEIAAAVRRSVTEAHNLPVSSLVLIRRGQIPRTSSGKPQRSLCRKRYLNGELEIIAEIKGRNQAHSEVSAGRVSEVSKAMAEILGMTYVKPDDDFFSLGGHSLMATQLVSRLEEIWDVNLPLPVVFEYTTPIALAGLYASLAKRPDEKKIVRVDRKGPLVLSCSQERMWFLHELEPDGAAYNVSGALIIEGPLDVRSFRTAYQRLVDAHETLRTRYIKVDGVPRPVIESRWSIDLPFFDVSKEPDPVGEARRRGTALAHEPFDLAKGPLIRLWLFYIGPGKHAIVLSTHHIVSDAWSLGVMLSDLLKYYYATFKNQPLAPENSDKLQYVDYAAWQRRWYDSRNLDSALEFWTNHVAGAPDLQLPTDYPRNGVPSSAGDLFSFEFPQELLEKIRDFANARGATPFMVILAAFQVLLYRYTRQTDFAVGIPIANRNHHMSEHLIGTLVNMLPFRCRLNPDESFDAFINETRQICIEAYAHQDLPFEILVSELQLERRSSQSPLIQVMLDYQNTPLGADPLLDFELKPLFISRRASQFDLSMLIMETDLGCVAGIEYRSEIFKRDTIARIARHFLSILESIAIDPAQTISAIPLMIALERNAVAQLGVNYSQGRLPSETAAHRIEAMAGISPQKIAVQDPGGAMTYEDLLNAVRNLASQLSETGVQPGCRVAILLQRSRFLPVALLAVHWTGGAYVPLDPNFPAERLEFMLKDSEPTIVLTDSASLSAHPMLESFPSLILDTIDIKHVAAPLRCLAPPDGTAYIIYTSGSTGKPKGVEILQSAFLNFLDSMKHTPGFTSHDHILSVTTVSFDIAGLELFLPLICGGTVSVAPGDATSNGSKLADMLEHTGATVMQATPATWRMLIETGWLGDNKLKILCGGEALTSDLAEQLLDRSGSLWNMYGPTETTVWSSVHQVTSPKEITIGRPIDRTRMYVLDDHLQILPPGVSGELFIGGAGVARGYFKRASLTTERFLPDPFVTDDPHAEMYRTGDLARMQQDGIFECLGRIDNQVKIRGHRVELEDIEAAIKTLPNVQNTVAKAFEIAPGDIRIIAYYISETLQDEDGLRKALRLKLPNYMMPFRFVPIISFPLTPNGKIDRKALLLPESINVTSERKRVLPRNLAEERVAEIWSSVLQVPEPSVLDNFFDFGHSLLAARLFSRIDSELGVKLPLSILFEHPTIADLALLVGTERESRPPEEQKGFSFVVGIKPRGSRPPLFCVHGAGGNVLNVHKLAVHLPEDQPFYGIQSKGVDGIDKPFETIEEMAEAYLNEVYQVQPMPPYLICGYSGGGVVAFEMARRLMEAGKEVALLCLIDTFRPGVKTRLPGSLNRTWAGALKGPVYFTQRCSAKYKEHAKVSAHRRRIHKNLKKGLPVEYEDREQWLMDTFVRAVRKYELQPYPGELTVLRARDVPEMLECKEPNLGWDSYAQMGIRLYEVPGEHMTLVEEPNVGKLAGILMRCIDGSYPERESRASYYPLRESRASYCQERGSRTSSYPGRESRTSYYQERGSRTSSYPGRRSRTSYYSK